jgi:hypothetical protein
MKITIKLAPAGRGHAFGRAGAGRKTMVADRRRARRTTDKVKLRKEIGCRPYWAS